MYRVTTGLVNIRHIAHLLGAKVEKEEIAEIEYRFKALKPYQKPGSPDFVTAVQ